MTDYEIKSAYKKFVEIYQDDPARLSEIRHAYQTLRTTNQRTRHNILDFRLTDVVLDAKENIKAAKRTGLGAMGGMIGAYLSVRRGIPADLLVNPVLWHMLVGMGTGTAVGAFAPKIVGPAQTAVSLLVNTTSRFALLAHEKLRAYTPSPLRKSIAIANATKISSLFAFYAASAGSAYLGYGLTRMALIKTMRTLGLG